LTNAQPGREQRVRRQDKDDQWQDERRRLDIDLERPAADALVREPRHDGLPAAKLVFISAVSRCCVGAVLRWSVHPELCSRTPLSVEDLMDAFNGKDHPRSWSARAPTETVGRRAPSALLGNRAPDRSCERALVTCARPRCQGELIVVSGGTADVTGRCVGALRGRGVSADAQAYFGTRPGLATGSET